jgi:hypothetical protein
MSGQSSRPREQVGIRLDEHLVNLEREADVGHERDLGVTLVVARRTCARRLFNASDRGGGDQPSGSRATGTATDTTGPNPDPRRGFPAPSGFTR